MSAWVVTLLIGAAGVHFQSIIKNTNAIKRSVRRSKTAIKALIATRRGHPPNPEEFDAALPTSPQPLLGTRTGLRWICYRRSLKRNWLRFNHGVHYVGRAVANCFVAAFKWLGAKRRTRRDAPLELPPVLYPYETSYASLEQATEQKVAVDDIQLDWRAATDAREAVRLCGIEFAVNIEDLPLPGLDPLGPPGSDFYVYATERCIIWARPMNKRFRRQPR